MSIYGNYSASTKIGTLNTGDKIPSSAFSGANGGGGLGYDENLKAYWKCSGASTPIENSSVSDESLGSAADWTVTNGTFQQGSPPLNTALDFDDGDTYAEAGTSLSQFNFMHDTSALFTVVWWMKLSSLNPASQFMNTTQSSSQVGMGITLNTNEGFSYRIYNAAGEATAANTPADFMPNATNWFMYCFRYNESLANTNAVWRRDDGNEETNNKGAAAPSDSNAGNALRIGAKTGGIIAEFLDAQVNEVSLWHETLSSDNETSLYNDGDGLEIY